MGLKIDFTDREITPWAGISLMLKMLDQMSINDVISSLSLPQQGSNRGYSPEQLIIQFWISIWCGANYFDHLEVTRSDKVIQEIGETTCQTETCEKPRRLVMVRQEIKKRPKSTGNQLRLFPDDETYLNYRYSCFITNKTLSAKAIYDLYRGRADYENRIKEIKYDFGAGNFCMKKFWATETTMNFITTGYNLMSLFRQVVLQNKNIRTFLSSSKT